MCQFTLEKRLKYQHKTQMHTEFTVNVSDPHTAEEYQHLRLCVCVYHTQANLDFQQLCLHVERCLFTFLLKATVCFFWPFWLICSHVCSVLLFLHLIFPFWFSYKLTSVSEGNSPKKTYKNCIHEHWYWGYCSWSISALFLVLFEAK